MSRGMLTTSEQELGMRELCRINPFIDRASGSIGNLELDCTMGFLLHNRRPPIDLSITGYIGHPQIEQITRSQLAVNREIE